MAPQRSTGSSPASERPGHAGPYLLESTLGTGGMGVVHLATSRSGLRLAVKVVNTAYASDPEFRARFRQEVAAARRVSGAFTAPVVDADPDAERPWMATLFIDGPTLSERVKAHGPLDVEELRHLGAGLAEGLRDIHRAGVVHRDLKPSNVLLAPDGPKVIDFGISRPVDSDLRTETGKLIGTPPFMAPEQFQRPREVGPPADVFAMGAVLVHAATGRGPFDSDSPYIVAYQVVHDEPALDGVPEPLLDVIRGCLAKDPADRLSPDQVMAALRPASGATALVPPARRPIVDAPTPAPAARTRAALPGVLARAGRRAPVRWAATGVTLAAVVAAGAIGLHAGHGTPPSGGASSPHGAPAFHAWRTSLAAGAETGRTPACSAEGSVVYCTAPGVAATRLDARTGHVVWSVPDTRATGFAGQDAAPEVAGGLLYAVASGTRQLKAMDPTTGARRWSVAVPAAATVRYAAGSVLLVDPGRHTVRALNGATGEPRWSGHVDAGAFAWSQPGGRGGELIVGASSSDGTATVLVGLDAATGKTHWTRRIDGLLTPAGSTSGALVLLSQGVTGFTDSVVTLDPSTHSVRRFPLTAPLDQAQATVADGVAYLVSSAGTLSALDVRAPAAGRTARSWSLETAVSRASRPTVAAGRVYLSTGDGRLLAVAARSGTLLGTTTARPGKGGAAGPPTLTPPAVAGPAVVAATPDGAVFGVDAGDPTRW